MNKNVLLDVTMAEKEGTYSLLTAALLIFNTGFFLVIFLWFKYFFLNLKQADF